MSHIRWKARDVGPFFEYTELNRKPRNVRRFLESVDLFNNIVKVNRQPTKLIQINPPSHS